MGTNIVMPYTRIYKTKLGTVTLSWHRDFPKKWQTRHVNAQLDTAAEIIRLSEPFIPKDTGFLISSGAVEMDAMKEVTAVWNAPYARWQFFSPRAPGSKTGPLRGPYWFHRMKAVYLKYFLDRSKAILKGLKLPRKPRVRSR